MATKKAPAKTATSSKPPAKTNAPKKAPAPKAGPAATEPDEGGGKGGADMTR